MSYLSVGYAIRQSVSGLLVAANIDPVGANIKVRMMTKATKVIDTFPICVVSPYMTILDKPADFGGSRDRGYRTRIALIDAMSGDTETKDDLYSAWIEAALNAIVVDSSGYARTQLPGIDREWQMEAESVNTFDDSKMETGYYAFQNLVIRFDLQ